MTTTAGLLEGAEPFSGGSGTTGVLLIHGFTSSPRSLRPWADDLVARGYRVELPLLPGHGTRWEDMDRVTWNDWYAAVDRAYDTLAAQTDQVFVAALSMGGALALELGAQRDVAGLVLVNPSVGTRDKRFLALPILSVLRRSVAAIGSDIAMPDVAEGAYDRTPLKGVVQLTKLWRAARANLPRVTAPVLLFLSQTDHVVDPSSAATILRDIGSHDVRQVMLERSFHVATLDYDAQEIFAGSAGFIASLVRR
ncbi:MAG TPA: alpha/beta fold hydrolase [Propionibacteriaceae bacterium]|nr:alpha/beta fold hydrolase [Propionibacteriaceae bacterium]